MNENNFIGCVTCVRGMTEWMPVETWKYDQWFDKEAMETQKKMKNVNTDMGQRYKKGCHKGSFPWKINKPGQEGMILPYYFGNTPIHKLDL